MHMVVAVNDQFGPGSAITREQYRRIEQTLVTRCFADRGMMDHDDTE